MKITGVSIGLPSVTRPIDRDDPGVAKFAAWAPVYVSLEVLSEVSELAEIFIEAPDTDELITTLAIPLNLAGAPGGSRVYAPDRGAMGYVRPAGSSSEVTVTVRTKSGTPLSRAAPCAAASAGTPSVCRAGDSAAPAGFELPKPATGGSEIGTLRGGRIELAHIDRAAELPDEWFGYEAADLVLLNTGKASPAFLRHLFASEAPADKRKRDALLEWVRRGGRIVVSVGANAKLSTELPYLQEFLPYTVKSDAPTRTTDAVALYWSAGVTGQGNVMSGALGRKGSPPFPMANLLPRANVKARVVIPPPARQSEEREPVAGAVRAGSRPRDGRRLRSGLGSVRGLPAAEGVLGLGAARRRHANRASAGGDLKPRPPGALTEEEDEAAAAIRHHNDTFDGVAVVSFGWIALLIGLYILLIGPIEYYFLKRILGRLELTWITFPIIVLSASALAYLSADAVKGRELKVNKIDVVDVDPESNHVYGTTWFTVFSPKIDTYTIGVVPGEGWGFGPFAGAPVNWLAHPRSGRPGFVRRKYAVHVEGETVDDGLENVPIQVWSTKAFAANWSAPSRKPSGFEIQGPRLTLSLTHPPGDRAKVIGTFRHDLPVPVLTDCVAFYAGQAYPLPGEVIVRGEPVRLVLDQGEPASRWLQTRGQLDMLLNRVQSYAERPGQKLSQKQQLQAFTGPLPLWGVLFHEGTLKNEEGTYARNASLRRLDQSWRLSPDNRDEVIIVGRAVPQYGPAEEILTGPNSPSRLWLKGLPGSGERQPISGTARQETWVRFYLPVR